MKHRHHDGGHPGGLAIAGVEIILKVRVEDSHAGGERQGQRQDHDCGKKHHPAPTAIWSRHGRGAPVSTGVAALLAFVVWSFLLLHTAGLLTNLVCPGMEAVITCPRDSIPLSHFLRQFSRGSCVGSAGCVITSEAHITVTAAGFKDTCENKANIRLCSAAEVALTGKPVGPPC